MVCSLDPNANMSCALLVAMLHVDSALLKVNLKADDISVLYGPRTSLLDAPKG